MRARHGKLVREGKKRHGCDPSCAHLTSVRLTNAGTREASAAPGRVDIEQMDERNDTANNLLGDRSPDVCGTGVLSPAGLTVKTPHLNSPLSLLHTRWRDFDQRSVKPPCHCHERHTSPRPPGDWLEGHPCPHWPTLWAVTGCCLQSSCPSTREPRAAYSGVFSLQENK